MEILTKTEVQKHYDEIIEKIKQGIVFIHPFDTIYGLGCNALDAKAVEKVRSLKEQFHQPMSIWVPSLEWVKKNCVITKETEEALTKLPGPYTVILKLNKNNGLAQKE